MSLSANAALKGYPKREVGVSFILPSLKLTFKLTRTWLSQMSDGSEPRKTRSNEKDQSNNLRQRLSFCSFSELPDDVSWAWDESLWPVPALFHAVVAVEQASPTGAKGWAEPVAPAPTSLPWSVSPTVDSTPAPEDEPVPADCERRRRSASSVASVAGCSAVAHPRATPVCQSDNHAHASSATDTLG